jgi:hypothetical protein
MYKSSALLSIGAALVFSLFFFGVGHAFQIEKKQDARILMAGQMKGTANLSIKQVSTAQIPCGGRTGALCSMNSLPGSGEMATAGSRYTSHGSNTPIPCGGRTGASCTQQSPQGSGATATDGSLNTSATSAAGMLFGVGLTTLVVLGARRLRHPHGHHA